LGNGRDFGLKHLSYTYQQGEGGIADALRLAEHFADDGPICVVLGDNLIQGNIAKAAGAFRAQKKGAKILLKEVKDPQRFGVPHLEGESSAEYRGKTGTASSSSYAVTGIYFYDARVSSRLPGH
jgi:glucose-1-phosphate thymidylyltransferase